MPQKSCAQIRRELSVQNGRYHADPVQTRAVAGLCHLVARTAVEVFPNEFGNTSFCAGAQVIQGGVFCV